MPVDRYGLTPKQRKFCDLYVKTGNGAEAARSAGYSEDCARVIASRTLSKANVRKYVDIKMEEAVEKVGVTKEWRLEMLKKGIDLNFQGKADKEGCIDLNGLKGLISEINKMAGDYAPTTSNLNVSESKLDDMDDDVKEAEKEINEIKTF